MHEIWTISFKNRRRHFIANDGCRQDQKESPIQLSADEELVRDHNLLLTPLFWKP